jgi:uracil-DNA glycosylase family protein
VESLASLRRAAVDCRACPLWKSATQTVFGEGPADAAVMLVGEQPGDQEDRQRQPFVGPAGRILDEALAAAGIARDTTYVTNAVKHFKWKARGKRRIHDKPSWSEVAACRPWLEGEAAALQPEAIVALGATAARAVLGRAVAITRERGQQFESDLAPLVVVTFHPSAVLRAQDARDELQAALTDDLRIVAKHLDGSRSGRSA